MLRDNTARFGVVGLVGLVVDLVLFNVLSSAGLGLVPAHVISFLAAGAFDYYLWTLCTSAQFRGETGWRTHTRFLVVCALALFLRGGVLAYLTETAGWPPQRAIYLAIAAGGLVSLMGMACFVFPGAIARTTRVTQKRLYVICIVGYSLLLRLTYGGVMDLIPEEAYYWNYAQHLDIGYLDHPPMVSWLIWLSTLVFGNREIAVRFPAFVSWLVTAAFMYGLSNNLLGKKAAPSTVVLLAVLPIYFGTGLLMTPDAPLFAAWAGSLYFLERALLGKRRRAWLGVGIFLGIGMLSKYTIALLGPATLVFILWDRESRRWLLRPEPYMAAACAAAVFLPVIIWNARNEWASFVFQGPRRWSGGGDFSLHLLLGWAIVLLTPVGAMRAFVAALPRWRKNLPTSGGQERGERRWRFMLTFTLVPLSVFILHSIWHEPKLNWTGPVWLAILPLLGMDMGRGGQGLAGRLANFGRALWRPTVMVALLVYGGGMYWIVLGTPGAAQMRHMQLPVAWEEMGEEVEAIEDRIKLETGQELIIIGMDKLFISSEVSFYDSDGDGPAEVSGRHLVGRTSLMWNRWGSPTAALGQNVLMISFDRGHLERSSLAEHFRGLGEIVREDVKKGSRVPGRFYYRVGRGYRG